MLFYSVFLTAKLTFIFLFSSKSIPQIHTHAMYLWIPVEAHAFFRLCFVSNFNVSSSEELFTHRPRLCVLYLFVCVSIGLVCRRGLLTKYPQVVPLKDRIIQGINEGTLQYRYYNGTQWKLTEEDIMPAEAAMDAQQIGTMMRDIVQQFSTSIETTLMAIVHKQNALEERIANIERAQQQFVAGPFLQHFADRVADGREERRAEGAAQSSNAYRKRRHPRALRRASATDTRNVRAHASPRTPTPSSRWTPTRWIFRCGTRNFSRGVRVWGFFFATTADRKQRNLTKAVIDLLQLQTKSNSLTVIRRCILRIAYDFFRNEYMPVFRFRAPAKRTRPGGGMD